MSVSRLEPLANLRLDSESGSESGLYMVCASGVDAVESAAIDTLLALTLKLSEKAFKPRFLRFLEWAATAPAGAQQQGGLPLGRAAALFGAVHALTSRLRYDGRI